MNLGEKTTVFIGYFRRTKVFKIRKECIFKLKGECFSEYFQVLECIILSEETTTSSSRIFVKIFFQELSEYMGLPNLNARLKDE